MKKPIDLRRSLDESLQDALVPGAIIVGLAYLLAGTFRWVVDHPGSEIYGPIEVATALALFAFAERVRTRRFPAEPAQRLIAVPVIAILLNSVVLVFTHHEETLGVGIYLVAAGVGILSFRWRWHVGLVGAALAVWLLGFFHSELPPSEWVERSIAMLSAILLGVLISVWRAQFGARLLALREEADASRDAHDQMTERYREVTEGATDMICEIDEYGRILYANPAHEAILGFKPENLIGRPGAALLAPDVEIDARALARGLSGIKPHQRVMQALHRDGSERTLECNVRPFTLPSGELRIVLTTRDITERAAATRALEENRDQLETLVAERTAALESSLRELQRSERLASMGTLAAGIAHQINNPIGSILMSADLALQSQGDADERTIWEDALRNSVEQARRCGRIVSNMLQFSRNEPTEKAAEDLSVIVGRVCRQIEAYAMRMHATLDTSDVEGPLPVWGSAIELEQALLNILRNAAESSNGTVRIRVGADRSDDAARVTVRDDGAGMSQEDADRAFDPFFTTRLSRGGTGLGLSVAHGVVTDHDGTLSIESARGIGTTIVLTLPLISAEATHEGARHE